MSDNPTYWVVSHHEVYQIGDELVYDGINVHLASSRSKAEQYLKRHQGIAKFSWWQISPFELNGRVEWLDEPGKTFYYNHKGACVKDDVIHKAVIAYKRERKRKDTRVMASPSMVRDTDKLTGP